MNTRLQVEHPVTEIVTGLDLVHLQLRIASGGKLPFRQEEIAIRGHAIECRIYAEDADNNFFPSPGKITKLLQPSGPGIREDSGVYEGWTVPLDYDPMLSKLIAYGSDRPATIARMRRALDEYFIGGIKTNVPLFRRILEHRDFAEARIDTGFLDRMLAEKNGVGSESEGLRDVAVVSAALFAAVSGKNVVNGIGRPQGEKNGAAQWKRIARIEALRNE